MQLGHLGVWYSMDKLATPEQIRTFATSIEQRGYDVLWYPEFARLRIALRRRSCTGSNQPSQTRKLDRQHLRAYCWC